jgi:hypothetical protein
MELTQQRKSFFIEAICNKVFLSVLLSFFAALGTVPYGYRFAEYFGWHNAAFSVVFGALFAFCAASANIMLGTYSLLNIKNDKQSKLNFKILLVSTLGSMPYGFLCYFGYESTLPLLVNIIISVIVVIVNAGIGYTAINNLLQSIQDMRQNPKANKFQPQVIFRILGFVIGLLISLVTYLAASSGITDLLIHFNQTQWVNYHAGFILAILSWIPCAALFANANQVVAGDLYEKLSDFKTFLKGISLANLMFLAYCLASGTAIAQMTSDSFEPAKNIPAFFKIDYIQFLVQHYLIIIALFSSAALNYFSIQRLMQKFKKRNSASLKLVN